MKNIDMIKLIQERLRKLIEDKNDTDYHCTAPKQAKDMHIPYNTFKKYEDGISEPSASNLKKMADYYGVSCDYLLGGTNYKGTKQDVRFISDYTGLYGSAVETLRVLSSAQQNETVRQINQATLDFINRELGNYPADENRIELESMPINTLFTIMEKYIRSDSVRFRSKSTELTAGETVFFDSSSPFGLLEDTQMDFGDAPELYRQVLLSQIRNQLEEMRKSVKEESGNG